MARRIEITKEAMIQAAYEILEEEGYNAVNIKTIAAKAGCSTKPISWQFGNMLEMRKEIYKYASKQLYEGIEEKLSNLSALEAFFETGKIYISNAIESPNVFRFLCIDGPGDMLDETMNIKDLLGDDFIKEMLAKELPLSKEIIESIVADIVIYTHGLATMLLWDSIKLDKIAAYKMIYNQADMCFSKCGIDLKDYITKKGRSINDLFY